MKGSTWTLVFALRICVQSSLRDDDDVGGNAFDTTSGQVDHIDAFRDASIELPDGQTSALIEKEASSKTQDACNVCYSCPGGCYRDALHCTDFDEAEDDEEGITQKQCTEEGGTDCSEELSCDMITGSDSWLFSCDYSGTTPCSASGKNGCACPVGKRYNTDDEACSDTCEWREAQNREGRLIAMNKMMCDYCLSPEDALYFNRVRQTEKTKCKKKGRHSRKSCMRKYRSHRANDDMNLELCLTATKVLKQYFLPEVLSKSNGRAVMDAAFKARWC